MFFDDINKFMHHNHTRKQFDNQYNVKPENPYKTKFACVVCKISMTGETSLELKKHVLNIHGDKTKFICTVCNKIWLEEYAYKQHIMSKKCVNEISKLKIEGKHKINDHNKKIEPEYKCLICDEKIENFEKN